MERASRSTGVVKTKGKRKLSRVEQDKRKNKNGLVGAVHIGAIAIAQ